MPSETSSRSLTPLTVLNRRAVTSASKLERRYFAPGGAGLRAPARRLELLWEMPGNDGYLQLVGIMQNLSISRSLLTPTTIRHASRRKSADAAVAERPAHRLQIRGKTLYYQNTRDGAEDAQDDLVRQSRTMAAKAAHVRSDNPPALHQTVPSPLAGEG